RKAALDKQINLRYFDEPAVGISFDEAKDLDHAAQLLNLFAGSDGSNQEVDVDSLATDATVDFPDALTRTSDYMEHPVFILYHTQHEMLRYLNKLENRDLSLTYSMSTL